MYVHILSYNKVYTHTYIKSNEGGDLMAMRKDSNRKALHKGESQRKDGLYIYRVMIDGKNIKLSASTLEELRKKEDELNKKMDAGIDMDQQRTTLNELADRYLENKSKSVQETTFQTMTVYYDRHIRNGLGKKRLADLKRSTIKEFYLGLISGKNPLSIATVARLNSILKPMFDFAVRDDVIMKNPADGVIGEIKNETKSKQKKVPSLTDESQKEFIRYVKNMDNHKFVRNMIIVLIGTGTRIGEIIGLRWEDIDFKKNVIDINHAIGYIKRDGKYTHIAKGPKSMAGNRKIPMLSEVRNALLEQKALMEIMNFEQPVVDGYTDFVFLSERGNIVTRENVRAQIKQIIDEHNELYTDSKLPQFTTHQLRHTFATLLCKNTNDLKAAQKILGHSDISMTMNVYVDATDDGVKRTMESLEGVMFDSPDEKADHNNSVNEDSGTEAKKGKVIKYPNRNAV